MLRKLKTVKNSFGCFLLKIIKTSETSETQSIENFHPTFFPLSESILHPILPITLNSSGGAKVDADHPPPFNCYCFRCYMSYWAKWDSSPNRELMHEAIDAFEEILFMRNKEDKSKKERRKGKSVKGSCQSSDELKKSEFSLMKNDFDESNSALESTGAGGETGGVEAEEDDVKEEDLENGSVRKFASFLEIRFGAFGVENVLSSFYFCKLIVPHFLTGAIGIALVIVFTLFFVYEQYEEEIDGMAKVVFNRLRKA